MSKNKAGYRIGIAMFVHAGPEDEVIYQGGYDDVVQPPPYSEDDPQLLGIHLEALARISALLTIRKAAAGSPSLMSEKLLWAIKNKDYTVRANVLYHRKVEPE